jgi:hypothetical protein
MMESTPELSAVVICPVWKGGLNRTIGTFGYLFVRKNDNPHKIDTLINASSQVAKMQGIFNDRTMQQLQELERTAIQANMALQTMYDQLEEQSKLLKAMKEADDGKA